MDVRVDHKKGWVPKNWCLRTVVLEKTFESESSVAQMIKNLSAMQETQVRSLDQNDPLEKGMVASYTVCGVERVRHDWVTNTTTTGKQAVQTSQFQRNQPWTFTGRTHAEAEAPILCPPDMNSQLIGKRPWCRERLKAKGEQGSRGWDGWMASPTQWTWVLANSRRCDGQGSLACCWPWGHRVGHDGVTEQQ